MRSAQSSFILEFDRRDEPFAGPLAGRIEHVLSGKAAEFASAAEMLAFIDRILSPGHSPQSNLGAVE